MKLELALQLVAVGQLTIAFINLGLIQLLKWKPEVEKMSLLVREVFYVHMWFISITLWIFAALTWRFAPELATGTDDLHRWLAAGMGIFWAVRTVLQVTWYSSSHWRGLTGRTVAHVVLFLTYGGFATTYLLAAFQGLKGAYACIF